MNALISQPVAFLSKCYSAVFPTITPPAKVFYDNYIETGIPAILDMHIDSHQFYKYNTKHLARYHKSVAMRVETVGNPLMHDNPRTSAARIAIVQCITADIANNGYQFNVSCMNSLFTAEGIMELYEDSSIPTDCKVGLTIFWNAYGYRKSTSGTHVKQSLSFLQALQALSRGLQSDLVLFDDLHAIMKGR